MAQADENTVFARSTAILAPPLRFTNSREDAPEVYVNRPQFSRYLSVRIWPVFACFDRQLWVEPGLSRQAASGRSTLK